MIFACGKTFAEPDGRFIPQIPPIYAHPDVVEYAIKQYVVAPYDPNKVTAAYEQYMNQNDGTITMENLQQKVCPAGGMDKARCKEFTNALMVPYYDVCDSGKGKSGGNEHCEKNFFYYAAPKNLSFGQGTYVRLKEAIGLAQEYALVKDKQKVVCVSTKGNSKKTDTIWCTSIDKKHFYEFKFNNIKETKDDYIKQSLLGAICKLHNTQYFTGGVGAATLGTTPGYSWPDSCETADKFICTNINKSLGRFSYKATIGTSDVPPTGKHSTCVIEKIVNEVSNLRTAYGIDPSVFKNVQAVAGEDIDKKIKQYVKQELQKQKITFDEKAFYCADSTNVLNGGDVLTCYVNNKPIDFLFKDLSEWSGVNKRGGAQAMDCIVSGGTYTGKRCTNLNQKQCEMLRSANLKSCPSCNMVRWDAKNNVCTLPSSAAATNLQKDIKVVAIVGGAVVGAAITIATAGTAGLTVGGYVILGVETTGAGIELWSQSKIDGIADEFLITSNQCKDASCAEQLIAENLQRLTNLSHDIQPEEKDAIDRELERLNTFISEDSQFYIDMLAGENPTDINTKKLWDSDGWEPEQVWRAVGIALQLASVGTAVVKWLGLRGAKFMASNFPRATTSITNKAKTARLALAEKLNKGQVIKNSKGIEIPAGKLGAAWRDATGKVIVENPSKYTMVNSIENALKKYFGKNLNMAQTDSGLLYYVRLDRDIDIEDFSKALRQVGVEHSVNGKTIYFKESDLAMFGERDLGDISGKVSFADDLQCRLAKTYGDEEGILRGSAEAIDMFKNSLSQEDLYRVAVQKRQKFLTTILNDDDLLESAVNFTSLTNDKKQKFAQKIVDKLELPGVKVKVMDVYSAAGEAKGRTIYLGANYNDFYSLDGFINTLAHEHNHLIDELAPNLGALGNKLYDANNVGIWSTKTEQIFGAARSDELYINQLSEQASYYIGNFVGDGFTDELIENIPESTLLKFQF